jgi:Fe-S-cluster containining protein
MDCRNCGACCTYFHKSDDNDPNYPLWGVPINPLFNQVPSKFVQIGRRLRICDSQIDADNGISYETTRFVRPDGFKCSALKGTVGSDVSCVIYDNRPPVCRNFTAGSERCLEARESELKL